MLWEVHLPKNWSSPKFPCLRKWLVAPPALSEPNVNLQASNPNRSIKAEKCFCQTYRLKLKSDFRAGIPWTHHFNQRSKRSSRHKTNCLCQIRLVLGLRTTTTKPGSCPKPPRSPTFSCKISAGRNKPTKPNQTAKAHAQACFRSQPFSRQPLWMPCRINPSKTKVVIGIRERTGRSDLHPWMHRQVPRNNDPEIFKPLCKPNTPKVTQYNLSPSAWASSTTCSTQPSINWGGVVFEGKCPCLPILLRRSVPASIRLRR